MKTIKKQYIRFKVLFLWHNSFLKFFEYRCFSYYFNEEVKKFLPKLLDLNSLTCNQIHQNYGQGIKSQENYDQLKLFYGFNYIYK